MKNTDWTENKIFTRALEILPGLIAWSILLIPIIFSQIYPVAVAYFILSFNFYWFAKAFNIMRHMLAGFSVMWRSMKINWLDRCKAVSEDVTLYKETLWKEYERTNSKFSHRSWQEIENIGENTAVIKDWKEIYHAVFITNCFEDFEITDPAYQALVDSNYPNEKIIIVSCGEGRDAAAYTEVSKKLKEKYGKTFFDIMFFLHEDMPGDVIGKGPNLSSAGHKFIAQMEKVHPEISPENILVTTLDADHIIHKEYLAGLTYKYIIDVNRHRKTYQPVPLLLNNIWDAPAPSRVLAIASSFWLMVELMRPYRLRTFAAHSQSLQTLLVTDFWSSKTIVEDGHQYWRTYFAYNGDQEMVSVFLPVYQDCVLATSFWLTLKNQYFQRRRWAWGISDFPFVVKSYIKHSEISLGEKFLQTFRLLAGHISWSTSSFLIAFAWVPVTFNQAFQDTVLAHNVSIYSSNLLTLAWVGVFANVWIYLMILPPLPKDRRKTDYVGMILQWLIAPVVAIFFSSLPALESQTRLLLGQSLNVFWVTPKVKVRR